MLFHGQTVSIPYSLLDSGEYQVNHGKAKWVFSITLAFAENLDLLISKQLNTGGGFHFAFGLLDTGFASEIFHDLSNPVFAAERFIATILASKKDLITLLRQLSIVTIHLCQEEQIIGTANIPLSSLISANEFTVVEQVYNLFDQEGNIPMSHDSRVSGIGTSLSVESVPVVITDAQRSEAPVKRLVSPSPKKTIPIEDERPLPVPPQPTWKPAEPEGSANFSAWRQYRFSIDLLEIQDYRGPDSLVYLKYSYSPFGTSSNICTATVSLSQNQQSAHLQHSFSAFEFIMGYDRLCTYLEGVPLIIEVWKKDVTMSSDVCLGLASIDLSQVTLAKKSVSDYNDQPQDASIKIQSCSLIALIAGTQDLSFAKVGDLRLTLALEDFGQVEESELDPIKAADEPVRTAEKQTLPYLSAGMSQEIKDDADMDEQEASQSRLQKQNAELEMQVWKKEQEQAFRKELMEKEMQLVEKLSAEWQARENEREKILKKKMSDFRSLENQVQELLVDLEMRERNVASNEEALVKKREDLERDSKRRIEDMREGSRRIQDDCKLDLERERAKYTETDALLRAAQSDKKDLEAKYKQLESDFIKLRLSLNDSPEKVLQEELDKLEKERDALEKSKRNYKSLYSKAAKELSTIKRDLKMEGEEKVLKERRELESLKLKQFAQEDMMKSKAEDDRKLMEIKQELSELKHKSHVGITRSSNSGEEERKKYRADRENRDPKVRGEIERLLKEKQNLLDTGLYSPSDIVVGEIEAKVEELKISHEPDLGLELANGRALLLKPYSAMNDTAKLEPDLGLEPTSVEPEPGTTPEPRVGTPFILSPTVMIISLGFLVAVLVLILLVMYVRQRKKRDARVNPWKNKKNEGEG